VREGNSFNCLVSLVAGFFVTIVVSLVSMQAGIIFWLEVLMTTFQQGLNTIKLTG
jgi:hypothetical protein